MGEPSTAVGLGPARVELDGFAVISDSFVIKAFFVSGDTFIEIVLRSFGPLSQTSEKPAKAKLKQRSL